MADEAEGAVWSALLDALADESALCDSAGWLVGGCLRDALLGAPVQDVDVALAAEPLAVAERLARRMRLRVAHLGHGTIRLSSRQTAARALDLNALEGSDITADLARRDFTVNAMALPLAAREQWQALVTGQSEEMPDLIDPFAGREHLLEQRLVAVGPGSFRYDPGRVVRAARMRARFGLLPDGQTLEQARAAAPLIGALTPDRLRAELDLLLALPAATDGVALLDQVDALVILFPGLDAPNALAVLRQLDRLIGASGAVAGFAWLRAWSASAARALKLRRQILAQARDDAGAAPVLWPQARAVLETDDDGARLHAARLLFLSAGKREALAGDALVVAAARALDDLDDGEPLRAALLATRADALLGEYLSRREQLVPTPLLDGKDLMLTLEVPAGPALGRLLHAVRLAQLADVVRDRAGALALARQLKETALANAVPDS